VVYLPVMTRRWSAPCCGSGSTIPGGPRNEALRFAHLPTSNCPTAPTPRLVSLVIVATWANLGGTVLIYLAALQGIPVSCTRRPSWTARASGNASACDDPQTRFIILMLMLLQIIATMQVFTEPS